MCSAPHERYLAVTVKEEQYLSGTTKYPPLLFTAPCQTDGARDALEGYRFYGPLDAGGHVESQTDHIVHICAGSWERAELLDAQVRAAASSPAAPYIRLFQQDVGRRSSSGMRLTELEAKTPDSAARDTHVDTRARRGTLRSARSQGTRQRGPDSRLVPT